ncbi:unnamed protein product [Phytophthora fragariaefolia]|uniref:Unnamed protein product n=1 Tax=Phytophthora fragariaefolia TaxID=1490495 RepID=A0A9W6YC41_9STRA|nr:unnamed protein product [Phytophthora fragariaefolia]
MLELNGELERARAAERIAKLKKIGTVPLASEDTLDIGEMQPEERDLVVALIWQYPNTVEKKEGCSPLAQMGVMHHINTGVTAPTMMRRRGMQCHRTRLLIKK